MKTIQKELGEGEDAKSPGDRRAAPKIDEAKMPEEVEKQAKKELAPARTHAGSRPASIRWSAPISNG